MHKHQRCTPMPDAGTHISLHAIRWTLAFRHLAIATGKAHWTASYCCDTALRTTHLAWFPAVVLIGIMFPSSQILDTLSRKQKQQQHHHQRTTVSSCSHSVVSLSATPLAIILPTKTLSIQHITPASSRVTHATTKFLLGLNHTLAAEL